MAASGRSSPEEEQRSVLVEGYRHADLSLEQLWARYFALGGNLDLFDVEAFLTGLVQVAPHERDMLAHAINERLDELRWQQRVPYSRPIRQRRPPTGPLAALVQLLESGRAAPPERLAALAAGAGRAMDVDVVVHLADHDQRQLCRLSPTGRPEQPATRIEGTLPGRVFQTVRVQAAEGDPPRLWVPLLDGTHRLGVLEVRLASAGDLYDPVLREQVTWLAGLLGHLVGAVLPYGDVLDRAQRARPRSPSAELIWQQLPPLTASTGAFTLAGMFEPSDDVGGDAFDYALAEHGVSLAIFDAQGHGLSAGLKVSAALAGYRSARRDGGSLDDQVRAVDEVIARHFPDEACVTGVLAELDIATGRLRYVGAGHPPPLVLRGGRTARALEGASRAPFGLGPSPSSVAETVLGPGDWLVLYTDGITEARDPSGAGFGEARMLEFLRRAAAADQPPAETVRRLTHAVLAHQRGVPTDDATVLLACWGNDRTV
jgi:hypothetical protein